MTLEWHVKGLVPMRFTSSSVPVGRMTPGCFSRDLIVGGWRRSSFPRTVGVSSSSSFPNRLALPLGRVCWCGVCWSRGCWGGVRWCGVYWVRNCWGEMSLCRKCLGGMCWVMMCWCVMWLVRVC